MDEQTVAVLGLGNMGRALVRALLADGHRVTGWNRTTVAELADCPGLTVLSDPAAAIRAAQTVIICVSSYAATHEILAQDGVEAALGGKTLVQLTTGRPEEASDLADWATRRGIRSLDGKIAVVPASIGLATTVIFYAGKEAVYASALPVLESLGGSPAYMGPEASAAAHADFAFLCYFFLSTIGLLYGAAFSKKAGLDPQRLLSLAPNFSKDMLDRVPSFRKALGSQDFSTEIQSSLKVDLNGARLLEETAAKLGLAAEPAAFISGCFDRAVRGGLAELDTAAITRLFGREI